MAEKIKINVKKRIKDIDDAIKKCKTYLYNSPDQAAEQRVKTLTDNPCISGMFYLNAIYKENTTESLSGDLANKYGEYTETTSRLC